MRDKQLPIRMTYSNGLAYLYLTDIGPGEVATSKTVITTENNHINLDFNRDGRLIGIEFVMGDETLPESLLKELLRIK